MIDFILLLIISSFWIWGINFIFKRGQLLGFIQDEGLPKWVTKPLFGCCACMSSVWGTIIFLACFSSVGIMGVLYPAFIICLVGINHIITAFVYDLE